MKWRKLQVLHLAEITMRLPDPAENFLESVIDYDRYARIYTRDDFTHEQKVEAVKQIEIMVLEALEYYYPDEIFLRYRMEKTS